MDRNNQLMDTPVVLPRQAEMALVRSRLKERKISYRRLADYTGKSTGWVGIVLRGGFPYYQAFQMPKNIADAMEKLDVDLPTCFQWPKLDRVPPTPAQLAYIARLSAQMGRESLVPASRQEATELIAELLSV